ncbi:MAG TPA: glycogen debranching protein GlgX, partial [Burkholderiales bacterium]|nr:glycogen debranching protein GlgX [Burkholderiales bacterium]
WGYNTLSYFAPNLRYTSSQQPLESVREFKMMVRALHAAGLEVILDVVYNHSGEADALGPTLCLRGLGNAQYYKLEPSDPRHYSDFTGCGNTLELNSPQALRLVADSLRYWVQEMHVDGFRFDLASALARELHAVDKLGAFFDIIHQDPVVSQVKLIAEPWDLGEGGYQVGNFPTKWTEWNGKYRDNVRRFWRGEGGVLSELATRLSGSSDLYEQSGRRPYASVNFVTSHDGFTLLDLVSYNEKHNEANGEGNADGENHNLSWNCGVEGPTADRRVLDLRERQRRNLMATLLLSVGVPMISGGDEMGRTQRGNNNAYCQDNEIGWVNWDNLGKPGDDMSDFVSHMTALRRSFAQLRSQRWLDGRRKDGSYGVLWLTPAAEEMQEADWNFPEGRFLAYVLAPMEQGQPPIFIVLNAAPEEIAFTLPKMPEHKNWQQVLNTTEAVESASNFASGAETKAPPRSVLAFAGMA